jgi:hypothetical protein
MMEFELPRSFVAVAECGGFHRAAAFGFARRSAHCASRKRIGLADRLHEPQSYGCPRRSPGWSRDHAASGERADVMSKKSSKESEWDITRIKSSPAGR